MNIDQLQWYLPLLHNRVISELLLVDTAGDEQENPDGRENSANPSARTKAPLMPVDLYWFPDANGLRYEIFCTGAFQLSDELSSMAFARQVVLAFVVKQNGSAYPLYWCR